MSKAILIQADTQSKKQTIKAVVWFVLVWHLQLLIQAVVAWAFPDPAFPADAGTPGRISG